MRAMSSSPPASVCAYAQAAIESTPTRARRGIFPRIGVMLIIVAESMLASRCDFVDKFVGTIPARFDDREALSFFEEIVASLEIAPESAQRRAFGGGCLSCLHAAAGRP